MYRTRSFSPSETTTPQSVVPEQQGFTGQADPGIIGSKEFVGEVSDQVKHLLRSKDERKFTPVGGVEGVYSMKRLRA